MTSVRRCCRRRRFFLNLLPLHNRCVHFVPFRIDCSRRCHCSFLSNALRQQHQLLRDVSCSFWEGFLLDHLSARNQLPVPLARAWHFHLFASAHQPQVSRVPLFRERFDRPRPDCFVQFLSLDPFRGLIHEQRLEQSGPLFPQKPNRTSNAKTKTISTRCQTGSCRPWTGASNLRTARHQAAKSCRLESSSPVGIDLASFPTNTGGGCFSGTVTPALTAPSSGLSRRPS